MTSKRFRLRVLTALAIATALVGAACGEGSSGGSSTQDITVMLNWTPNNHHAGLYIAQEEGYFKDAGLNVKLIEPAQAGVEAVVAAGKAQFGIAQAESVLPAREQGVPVVSIATIFPHNDSALMSLPAAGINRPKDLEGKTYGGYGGALETELISQLVKCDGGDPSKVKFVEVGNVDYLSGMQSKRFDVVWIFDGWDALKAKTVDNTPVNLIDFIDHTDCIPDWYTPVFITSEKMIADKPDQVKAFLSALSKGYELAASDPAKAVADLKKGAPELDDELIAASAEYYKTRYVAAGSKWGTQDAKVWDSFETFAEKAGLLKQKVDAGRAFTNDYLP
ncbi:MAG: ABC transporter substrate-binding protein [Acidimicrobiia bacterium]